MIGGYSFAHHEKKYLQKIFSIIIYKSHLPLQISKLYYKEAWSSMRNMERAALTRQYLVDPESNKIRPEKKKTFFNQKKIG